ncbi:hypothetical protein Glove_590g12 [Diversispora epigaea]|uniref:Uncharacterized protein n=1 Tax=Diversispora epigaea TaxID=1348612 RepID=A0A397GCI9_9GLOM|nr:hypothetical protein Glove_590g12 [Diversispora epigaea]
MSWLLRQNRVIEKQRFFQATDEPIWLRGGRARKPFLAIYFTTIGVGFLGALYGTVRLIQGKK